MNFVEYEIQRDLPFEKPMEKPYKDYAEITWFKQLKTYSSSVSVADSSLLNEYKRTSNKVEDSKSNNSFSKEFGSTKILIAEPEPDFGSLFKTFLETLGVRSATVAHGEAALEISLRKKTRVDRTTWSSWILI